MTALRLEPQTLLTVVAPTAGDRPAPIAACRATFWPRPAPSTLPKITSSTCSGGTFARSMAALMAVLPKAGAGTAKALRKNCPAEFAHRRPKIHPSTSLDPFSRLSKIKVHMAINTALIAWSGTPAEPPINQSPRPHHAAMPQPQHQLSDACFTISFMCWAADCEILSACSAVFCAHCDMVSAASPLTFRTRSDQVVKMRLFALSMD